MGGVAEGDAAALEQPDKVGWLVKAKGGVKGSEDVWERREIPREEGVGRFMNVSLTNYVSMMVFEGKMSGSCFENGNIYGSG